MKKSKAKKKKEGKQMLFQNGDLLLAKGIEMVVKYVNNDKAFLFPTEEGESEVYGKLMPWCAVDVVDSKGRLKDGTKVYGVVNFTCGAV